MRKIYFGVIGMMSIGAAFGQVPLAKKNLMTSEVKGKTQVPVTAKAVLWSNDFSSSAGWSIVDNAGSGDNWVIGTTPPTGSFAIDTINSTTRANGYALFDSDLLCSGNQNADLSISTVDLTTHPYVSLKFQSYYRRYLGNAYVIASADGINWTQIEVHTDLASNSSSANPAMVQVNLSSIIGGSATAYIGFRYIGGCDYAWMVDDVQLIETEQYDLAYTGLYWGTTGPWGARLPYSQIPLSQVQPIDFSGIAVNNGYATQNDVTFTAAIASSGYTSTSSVASVAANEIDTIDALTPFTPSAIGTYTVSGAITSSAMDATPTDNLNAASATFSVNNSIYARDMGDPISTTLNGGEEYVTGSIFDIYAPVTLYGADVFIGSTSEVDHDLLVRFYANGDTDFDILAEATHTVAAGEPGTMLTVWFDDPIDLDAGSAYLLAAGGYGDNGATDDITIGVNGSSEEQTTFIYDPSGTGGPWFFTSSVPVVRMNFSNPEGLKENASDFGVSVYPNPANDAAKVAFTLPTAGDATVSVMDVTGKVVYTTTLGNTAAGKQVVDLNTSGFAAGSYTVKISTADAMSTKKLVVRK